MKEEISIVESKKLEILLAIAAAASTLPFGEHPALPWCRESFPKLDAALNEWMDYLEKNRPGPSCGVDLELKTYWP